jgi:hypothetical protein
MKCGFYGIYAINCGLNARKQKKIKQKYAVGEDLSATFLMAKTSSPTAMWHPVGEASPTAPSQSAKEDDVISPSRQRVGPLLSAKFAYRKAGLC